MKNSVIEKITNAKKIVFVFQNLILFDKEKKFILFKFLEEVLF